METNLKYINLICTDLGGVGGHFTNLAGENEICTLLGGTGGHFTEISALNEICTIHGVTAGHVQVLAALNAIAGVTKVTNLDGWKYIQVGSVLSYSDEAKAFFARIETAGETISNAEKILVNDVYTNLKSNGLLTKLDCLWLAKTRIGIATSKLNWIKDAHNLEEVANGGTLTYTENLGFNSDGSKAYLRTNYNPSTQAIAFSQNNASFCVKIGGEITPTKTQGYGMDNLFIAETLSATIYNNINSTGSGSNEKRKVGYNCLSRTGATQSQYKDGIKNDVTKASAAPANREVYLLAQNSATGSSNHCNAGEIFEFGFIGAYLSQSEFNILRDIFNAYDAGMKYSDYVNLINCVVFTFDDGYETDATITKDLFVSKSVKFTSYLVSDWIGTAGFVSNAQVQALSSDGFDLGSHGKDHSDYTSLTTEQLIADNEAVNAKFESLGLTAPTLASYPHGAVNSGVINVVKNYRKSTRGYALGLIQKNSNKYLLATYSLESSPVLENWKTYIDSCVNDRRNSIMFYCHKTRVGDSSGAEVGLNLISGLIDHTTGNGLNIYTHEQLYNNILNA